MSEYNQNIVPKPGQYTGLVQVRPATRSDAAALSRFAARTFILACPPGTSQEAIDEHVATKLNEQCFADDLAHHELFVADGHDGELVGYSMLCAGPPPIECSWSDPAEVRRIYVDESLHGGGLADGLMQRCLSAAASAGRDQVWLGTNKANERALRFYRKHGFEIVGERTFQVGPELESDFVLARPVPTVEA